MVFALALAIVLAKGPLTMLVSLGTPAKVPAAAAVPNDNKFVFVVLIIPEVIVNVPLTDKGTFNVTPVALVLLTINEVKTFNEDEKVKEDAKAIVIYACAKKQTIEEYTKKNDFEDMDDETFSEAVEYINKHTQEFEDLYPSLKWW